MEGERQLEITVIVMPYLERFGKWRQFGQSPI